MTTKATKAFVVLAQDTGDALADFDTYEAAHYEAFGIFEQTGLQIEVIKGDELIWDSRYGYHCA